MLKCPYNDSEKRLHCIQKTLRCLYYFIYLSGCIGSPLLLAALSSCGKRELLFVAVRGLLIAVASLGAEHGLRARGLISCGSRAQ